MRRDMHPAIFGIGRNYADHAAEMKGAVPDRPLVFMKNPASVIADGEPIIIPAICLEGGPQVDYEGELAVRIGVDARDVPESQALRVIDAYAAANDVSARWWQREGSGGQFVRGKSFDTFCPISAWRPAADVGDPQNLTIRTTLNGDVMQEASTSQMLFTVAQLVAELSRGMTLAAGTVILTGTPAGVGVTRSPQRFLQGGDQVTIEISGVGSVRNPVQVSATG